MPFIHHGYLKAVDLAGGYYLTSGNAKGFKDAPVVFFHRIKVISHGVANIQGIKWGFAHSSQASEESTGNFVERREAIENKTVDT